MGDRNAPFAYRDAHGAAPRYPCMLTAEQSGSRRETRPLRAPWQHRPRTRRVASQRRTTDRSVRGQVRRVIRWQAGPYRRRALARRGTESARQPCVLSPRPRATLAGIRQTVGPTATSASLIRCNPWFVVGGLCSFALALAVRRQLAGAHEPPQCPRSEGRFIRHDALQRPPTQLTHDRIALRVVPDQPHRLLESPPLAPLPFKVIAP
jgi:hypothetical protein